LNGPFLGCMAQLVGRVRRVRVGRVCGLEFRPGGQGVGSPYPQHVPCRPWRHSGAFAEGSRSIGGMGPHLTLEPVDGTHLLLGQLLGRLDLAQLKLVGVRGNSTVIVCEPLGSVVHGPDRRLRAILDPDFAKYGFDVNLHRGLGY